MNSQSRIKNSLRNASVTIFSNMIILSLNFIVRTYFINILGKEYLGIEGLFVSLLNVLSIAELGIGNAILFRMYKPVKNRQANSYQALLNFYRKLYKNIAIIILVIGILFLPFLDIIISSENSIKEPIELIFILFLLNTVFSYLFIFKKSLLLADQKDYIVECIRVSKTIILSIIQIYILIVLEDFVLYLILQLTFTLLHNFIINSIVQKMYKLDVKKFELDKLQKREIFKDIKALSIYKISNIVVNSSDNIIISVYIGLSAVGVYANYYMLIQAVYVLTKSPLIAISSSIGNLNAGDNKEKKYLVYNSTIFIGAWFYGVVSILLSLYINNFITIWIGEQYIFSWPIVAILVVNFYLMGLLGIFNIFRNTFGLFVQGQYRPIIASVINLFFSMIFVNQFGILGVFLGTLISYLSISMWYDPWIVHRNAFKKPVVNFYFKLIKYFSVTLLIFYANYYILQKISHELSILNLFIQATISLIFSTIVFLLFFVNSKEFAYLYNDVFKKLFKIRKE